MEVKNKIIEEIRKIYDPEIPVNIYELGLIYDIKVKGKKAEIKMTLQHLIVLLQKVYLKKLKRVQCK